MSDSWVTSPEFVALMEEHLEDDVLAMFKTITGMAHIPDTKDPQTQAGGES